MEIACDFAGKLFVIGSRCEVASPIGIRPIAIREHVIVFGGPLYILSPDRINIIAWC